MYTAYRSPAITLTSQPSPDLHADLLVVPVFTDDHFGDEAMLDAASGGEVLRAQARGDLTGKLFEALATSTSLTKLEDAARLAGRRGESDRTSRPIICAALRSWVALRLGSGASPVSR